MSELPRYRSVGPYGRQSVQGYLAHDKARYPCTEQGYLARNKEQPPRTLQYD
jgi:hypothetical protein